MKFFFVSVFVLASLICYGQSKQVKLPANWFNLDLVTDGYFGISTEKAYQTILKNKKPERKVIVAVIDGGVDINHEDLKSVLWLNKKEIPNNGKDDDGNGYIDDIHGWNFIGSAVGNLTYDNLELVRIKRKLEPRFRSVIRTTVLDSAEQEDYALYKKVTEDFGKQYDEASSAFPVYIAIKKVMDSIGQLKGSKNLSITDIERYIPDDEIEEQVIKIIKKGAREDGSIEKFYKNIEKGYEELSVMLKYNLNAKYDERIKFVGDDYENANERFYGNSDVGGPDASHGSHVAGIIAADRYNNIGVNGISNAVEIMCIRVVPKGDERDKDVANGIRYAVDNGAHIINMSFGKAYKWDKKVVDEAVKYAESRGVLLVHAAGNEKENIDRKDFYPSKFFDSPESESYNKVHKKKEKTLDQILQKAPIGRYNTVSAQLKPDPIDTAKFALPHAKNWIEVGASAYHDDADLKASFSNYGKYTVDVFAPGFLINSTVPGSKYEEFDGTSMAAPVVSGLAALIWSYYPKLTAIQVKDIILKSVVKPLKKVKLTDVKGTTSRVPFAELCITGGIVNAYNALELASKISP